MQMSRSSDQATDGLTVTEGAVHAAPHQCLCDNGPHALLSALFADLRDRELIQISLKGRPFGWANFFLGGVEQAVQFSLAKKRTCDVYYGVAARLQESGEKDGVASVSAVWVDLDDKANRPSLDERLAVCPIPPSAKIASGGGYQLLWLLSQPVDVTKPENASLIEKVNLVAARAMGGDTAVQNVNRVLRLPGTTNFKYDPPRPAELVEFSPDLRYTIGELQQAFSSCSEVVARSDSLTANMEPVSLETVRVRQQDSGDADLPCRGIMWGGVAEGARDNACLELTKDLRRSGVREALAKTVMLGWNELNDPPLSEKEVIATVASTYRGEYLALGCEKMQDYCRPDCRVLIRQKEMEEADSEVPAILPLSCFAEIVSGEVKPPEFLVDGLVPRKGLTAVSGESGLGKSIIANNLAVSVASGEPFLHQFNCNQGTVLILDLENDDNTLNWRLKRIAAGLSTEDRNLPLHVVRIEGIASEYLKIDNPSGRALLDNTVAAIHPVLIIIDCLVAAHSQDENDNVRMRQVMDYLKGIARRHNLAVVVLHHLRKKGQYKESSGDRLRGAGDLKAVLDSHLCIHARGQNTVSVEHEKLRNAPDKVPTFRVEITDREDQTVLDVRYAGLDGMETKAEACRDAIVEMLRKSPELERSELSRKVLSVVEASKPTFKRALDDLVDEGGVEIDSDNKNMCRLATGRKAA